MPRRASRVRVGSLAAHLVQTPAFAVALVAELLHETAGIKVRPTRAMLMNVAVVGELRTLVLVEFRQRARVGKLQDHAQQRVRIRRAAGKIDDRLVRHEISHANRARWIGSAEGIPPHDAQEPMAMIAAAFPATSSRTSMAGRPASFM